MAIGITPAIPFNSPFNWAAWWASRTPSDIILTPVSDTEIQVDWTDGAEAADGIRIYVDGVLDGTADYGDGTYTIDGLTADTGYEITVVAYDGEHESPEISDSSTTWTTEYNAVYDSWTNKPSAGDSEKYNTLVKSWIDDGVWAKKDVLYNFAIHTNDAGEACVNWKNPGTHDATLVNAPAFVAYEGFTGDGASNYIEANYCGRTDGINYVLDSASFGLYFRTLEFGTDIAHGVYSTAGDGGLDNRLISGRANLTNLYLGVNDNLTQVADAVTTSGFIISTRNDALNHTIYINKVGTSFAKASTKIPDQDVVLLARRTTDGSVGLFNTSQISMGFLSSGYSQANVDDMTDDFEVYMDSNGTGIIT